PRLRIYPHALRADVPRERPPAIELQRPQLRGRLFLSHRSVATHPKESPPASHALMRDRGTGAIIFGKKQSSA
ncbi:hypothetical protein, partial [Mesorhizobium sp. M2D.F.Ca.ET.223.01.1.1]|uniref:hypothetical protein n=1 Tax=Mesorhizobium sp. M2D.F.Ca.ET.223.01.1.1 TaxID=2563940 RepID=UPI001AEDD566